MALIPHPVRAYLRHLRHAGNRHHVHSPFVFGLVADALRGNVAPPFAPPLEGLRHALLQCQDLVSVTDLGAGSRKHAGTLRQVRQIASTSLKPRRQAWQLARLTAYFKPSTVLELGTSLGLTTLYLAKAAPGAQVHTIEGCPAIAELAQAHFNRFTAPNIRLHQGSFQEQLPAVLAGIDRIDLAYIDGHHASAPTLGYFGQCLEKAHNDSVFIFDDIHWSSDMERAWEIIKQHPRVTVTIDLFHYGLAFLRREQQKEHFRLRY